MPLKEINDRQVLFDYFSKNKPLHIYEIGDLDDFFWPRTKWYGLTNNGLVEAVVLFYQGPGNPTVLALADELESMLILLEQAVDILPDIFFAHFSPGLANTINGHFLFDSHGSHLKMALKESAKLGSLNCEQAVCLDEQDLNEIYQLYKESYPESWFDPCMLETGKCFGIHQDGRLVSISGVHVFSKKYNVASLGNIATHPDYRGRGYGQIVTARTARELIKQVSTIGLNVKEDNYPAFKIYKKLGFEIVAEYEEHTVKRT